MLTKQVSDIAAANKGHGVLVVANLLLQLPVEVRRGDKHSEVAVAETRDKSASLANPN